MAPTRPPQAPRIGGGGGGPCIVPAGCAGGPRYVEDPNPRIIAKAAPATRLYEGTPFAAGPAWCEPTSLPLLQLLAATASVTGTVTFLADPFAKGYLGAGFDSAGLAAGFDGAQAAATIDGTEQSTARNRPRDSYPRDSSMR